MRASSCIDKTSKLCAKLPRSSPCYPSTRQIEKLVVRLGDAIASYNMLQMLQHSAYAMPPAAVIFIVKSAF